LKGLLQLSVCNSVIVLYITLKKGDACLMSAGLWTIIKKIVSDEL